MKWLIYKHTNKINGKCYVGQTKQVAEKRWQNGNGYSNNLHFCNAIKKYGWSNFEHEILEDSILSQEIANEREIFWIEHFDSFANGYNLTKGGDNREHLGIPILQIDCLSLEIINSFLTIRQAQDATGIDHSQISRCCYQDKKGIQAGGYYWCFQDDWFPEWTPKTKKIPNMRKKAVYQIDRNLNIVNKFISGLAAEQETGIPCARINRVCHRQGYITAGGYHWCFVEEWNENWKPAISKVEKKVVRISKDDFNDIVVYDSVVSAAADSAIANSETIIRACKGKQISAGNYYWCYDFDYDENWQPRENKNTKRIICIETNVVYDSINSAISATNGSSNISRACKDRGLTSGGFHWMYYDDYLKNGWRTREAKNGNKRAVICVETKEVFSSVQSAANSKLVGASQIVKGCKNHSSTTNGLHWAYLEEYDENWNIAQKQVGRHGMKKVKCIETNETFDCISAAHSKTGVDTSSIIRCCKGKQMLAGGYHWEYVNN